MQSTMRAVVITRPGDPDVLEVCTVPKPTPGPTDILVRVVTSGVNRADLLQRMGRYPVPDGYPEDILGLEYSGVVEEVGAGVDGFRPGDRVMGITGGGAYAEYLVAPAPIVLRIPERLDTVEAGAVPEVFITAFDAVVVQEGLTAGETLLIHAVGSGVGTAALQLARAFGARSIGTSRTPDKLERAKALGLDEAVVGGDAWPDRVLELTEGRGADVILDLVGGPYLSGNQRVLARRGRHIVVGVSGGSSAPVDLRALMGRRGSIRGTVLRARPLEEKTELVCAFQDQVVPFLNDGSVRPVVDRVVPAAEAGDAHRAIEANETFGKILLRWSDG